jgi:glycosyltransferase involved in cell wall biosynthesis
VKLGVDCRSLTKGQNGISHYLSGLLKALILDKNPSLEIVLFSPGKILDIYGEFNSKQICIVSTPKINNRYLRQIWSEVYLPMILMKHKVDFMWFPAHRIPLFVPSKIQTILTIHDLVWKHYPETMRLSTKVLDIFFMSRSIKVASRIAVVSEDVLKQVRRQYSPKQTLKVISPASIFENINLDQNTNLLKEEGIDQSFILFVGSFEPRKNIKNMLEAYSRLGKEVMVRVQFVCVGSDEWGLNIEEITQNLNIEKYVIIRRNVSNKVLASLYDKALFLVMPSLYEGFGMPLIEAMYFGTPAITSDRPPMRDIVGNTGILVNPKHIDSIKQGMQTLLFDYSLVVELGISAKERSKSYSWNKSARDFFKLLGVV